MKIKSLNVPCKSYACGTPIDGYEYECEYYDKNGLCVECDECVCNFGEINPINGKRINFILRFIQNRRAIKYYKIKNKESDKTANYFKSNPYKFINDYVGNLKWYQKLWLKLYCKRKDKQIKILSVDLASDSELHFNNGSQIIITNGKTTRGVRSKIKEIM